MKKLSENIEKYRNKKNPKDFSLKELLEIKESFEKEIKRFKGEEDVLRMLHVLKASLICNIEVKRQEEKYLSLKDNKVYVFCFIVFIFVVYKTYY